MGAMPAAARSSLSSRLVWILPVGLLALTVAALGVIVFLSGQANGESSRPNPPPFAPPSGDHGYTRFVARQAAGGQVLLALDTDQGATSSATENLGAGATIEVLRATKAPDLHVGEWLAVVGIRNDVRNFSIHQVVVLPAEAQRDQDGIARTAAGFAGNEAALIAQDAVALSGPIERVDGNVVMITGATGSVRVDLTDRSALFRIVPGTVSDIHEGDGVAVRGTAASPNAVLVQGR